MSKILSQYSLVDKKFIGIKYKFGGDSIEGIDCLNLILMYLRYNGINVSHSEELPINNTWWVNDPNKYVSGLLKYGDVVPIKFLQKLDIIIFSISSRKRIPAHAGVMVNGGWFLHIKENETSKVEMLNKKWMSLYSASIRIGRRFFLDNNQGVK